LPMDGLIAHMTYLAYKFGILQSSNSGDYNCRICRFWRWTKNWNIQVNISECTEPPFSKVTGSVDMWVKMINLTFILQ